MADSPSVDRTLAVVRTHFKAPPGARTRAHAALVARGSLPPSSGRAGSGLTGQQVVGVARSTVAWLAGLCFVAGFWFGRQHPSEPAPPLPAAMTPPNSTAAALDPSAAALPTFEVAPEAPVPAHAEPAVANTPISTRITSTGTAAADERPHAGHHTARAIRSHVDRENSSGEELALLQRAERAIRAREPNLALAFLDDIDRRYPKTHLTEERSAARLMARCVRADPDARAEAELFLTDQPLSVYRDRVRALCKIELSPRTQDGNRDRGH